MAVKKTELYSSLWASCDALRGGMDASQYKDYVLTLLFMKYVTDKYKGRRFAEIKVFDKANDDEQDPDKRTGCSFDDFVALKGNKNIGEGMDKIIARMTSANPSLKNIIDNVHFNDEAKLGKGKEMQDKLTTLVSIFERPELDFKKNKASGDDIIGDAYEYLMKNFATQSGKSKGQFYTPAEVSRILAKVIGLGDCEKKDVDVCDPACGSGSLLIRAVDEAKHGATGWGQEKDVSTAGLAKMNAVLHNQSTVAIRPGNTFSDPQYLESVDGREILKRFDFVVANPPFSMKNWTDGVKGKEYDRFDGYGAEPPEKNGDYAWLLHILKILKDDGKAAVILPHGVLFRGNAEATIRQSIIDRGWIKGIISLPANLFYGTGIPACILVLDKENAENREGVFMIDASRDFVKDGNKNRLRERDVYKIVTTFNEQITTDEKYARLVPMDEIVEKNGYNLNITRYIDSSEPEDLQSIDGHLLGGIPVADADALETYWQTFGGLREELFSELRPGFLRLNLGKDEIRAWIENNAAYAAYRGKVGCAFSRWRDAVDGTLRGITSNTAPKALIRGLAEELLTDFEPLTLLDKYDVYEVLLSYWNETMADDAALIVEDGYLAGREIEDVKEIQKSGKHKGEEKVVGWDGALIPKTTIAEVFFPEEIAAVEKAEQNLRDEENALEEYVEANGEDDNILQECKNDKGNIDGKLVAANLKELKGKESRADDYKILSEYDKREKRVKAARKLLKDKQAELESKCLGRYPKLTEDEIKDLLTNHKWYIAVKSGVDELYTAVSHRLTTRVTELAERYENTLPELEKTVEEDEEKVRRHLEKMGFQW